MIQVTIDGTPYTAFKEYNIERSMEDITSTFSFTLTTLDGGLFPVDRGASIIVEVDGKRFCNGYVDRVAISYSVNEHTITITGRDKTQDIIDSSLDSNLELNTPISLENIIKKVLSYLGLNLKLINQVGDIDLFQKSEIVSGEIGQNCWDFIDQYCRKREVMLTTDGDSNIIITQGSGVEINGMLLHKINGTVNNVKSANVEFNDDKRFSSYVVKSQLNPTAIGLSFNDSAAVPSTQIVSSKGSASDDAIRSTRKLVIKAETASSNQDALKRAEWEREIRRARALSYSLIVDGFKYGTNPGEIWEPLQVVSVIDDFASINDQLLIRKVNFNLSLESGQITTLELVPKIAYNLKPPKFKKKKKNKKGTPTLVFNLDA